MKYVIIAGSRTVSPTIEQIDEAIARLDPSGLLWVPSEWTDIVCGMANGADLAGKAWADAKGKHVIRCPITPRMVTQHGKYLAPKYRNHEMSRQADGALIFWDLRSGGSADMAARMVARGKPVAVIPWSASRAGKVDADAAPEPTIEELIDRSSIGAGLRDIRERGIEAHLVDLEREMHPRR